MKRIATSAAGRHPLRLLQLRQLDPRSQTRVESLENPTWTHFYCTIAHLSRDKPKKLVVRKFDDQVLITRGLISCDRPSNIC